jgi:hypothetical protein
MESTKLERCRREREQSLRARLATNGAYVALSWKSIDLINKEFCLMFNKEALEEPGMKDAHRLMKVYFEPKARTPPVITGFDQVISEYPKLFCEPDSTVPSHLANELTRMVKEVFRLRTQIKRHIGHVYFIFGVEEMLSNKAIGVRDVWLCVLSTYVRERELGLVLDKLEAQYPKVFKDEKFPVGDFF